MTSTTTPPAPTGTDYTTAAAMTRNMDSAYLALRTAAENGKPLDGATAYKIEASKAITAGLGGVTNQPYAGRLFRGVFKDLDEVIAQVDAAGKNIDPETRDSLIAKVSGETRADIVHPYLLDMPAKDENTRPSNVALDQYRVIEGMKAARSIINAPATPTPAPATP
ncbi:hypothetical protein J4208_04000 [Candidatus Woesearchaeota archaeon]|nr:hypothetical protein [Candidatus Woesearchaeota archaeon]